MTDKILYRVLFDENEEVARIFFEIKETNETIEGAHQIQKWANNLFEENKKLKSENEELKQEYICRKELTYSEKLLIEDFFNWLLNEVLK